MDGSDRSYGAMRLWGYGAVKSSGLIAPLPHCLIASLLLCLLVLASCATSYDAKGRYHVVRSGEDIWRIASAYRVSVQDLAELNNIQDPKNIRAGQRLYLPGHKGRAAFKKFPKKGGREPIKIDRTMFTWPVEGSVVSGFGIRNGRRHDGIDISARAGTPIKAAADGKVAFAKRLGGYGNTIILRHKDNYFTVYAHNQKNGVEVGKGVKRGDIIAYAGSTGRATGPHCHFEIRYRQKARNPLFFLPVRGK